MESQSQTNETFIGQLLCAAAVFAIGDALGPTGDGGKEKESRY